MLNSAEHEIFSASKYENANYCWHFHIYEGPANSFVTGFGLL